MSDITYADKNTGDSFSHTDANEIKTAVNSKRNKQPSTLYVTSDHAVTASEILDNDYISNYGATAEVDITLPAVSYNLSKTIVIEAAYIIEINPPSGEKLRYQKEELSTADYVIDSPADLASVAVITRMRTGAGGTWQWNIGVAQGTFSNPGRVSD